MLLKRAWFLFVSFFNACVVCLWIYHRMLALGFKTIVVVRGPVPMRQHTGLLNEHRNTRDILFTAIKVKPCIPKGGSKTVWTMWKRKTGRWTLNYCVICALLRRAEVKASLGLPGGAWVGSSEGPASASVMASTCEMFIFYPIWGLERGLLHPPKYSRKQRHGGFFLKSVACPREGLWCWEQCRWAAGEIAWRFISNIVTGCNFNKVL